MKTKKFLVPDGIEYFMPDQALKYEALKSKVLKIFSKYKYQYVIPPIFDDLDNLLNLNSSDLDKETIKILDVRSDGDVGIRADITPQISKIDYQLCMGTSNSKYSYMGDIYRPSSDQFDRKNPYQVGAEFFGSITKDVEIELMKLMLDIIMLSNEKKIIIELGDISIIDNFLSSLKLSELNKYELINLINYKSSGEISDFFNSNKLSKNKLTFILEFIQLSGDIMVIKEIKKLLKSFKMDFTTNLANLIQIEKSITRFKKPVEVQIDLCELHGFQYQTSTTYTAYVANLRKEISRGGKYNAYMLPNQKVRSATGFSLDLKDIFNLSIKGDRINV